MNSANSMIMGGINVGGGLDESSISKLGTVLGDTQKSNIVYTYRKPEQYIRENKKVHRNDPCPCGSGKKYKHCCLNSGIYEG